MNQRHMRPVVEEALSRFPLVFLTGARGSGKAQLAASLAHNRLVFSLDHRETLDTALSDPGRFAEDAGAEFTVLEGQRAPALIGKILDRARNEKKPGLALVTASADSEEMTDMPGDMNGYVAIFELLPLSWAEQAKRPAPNLIDHLFESASAKDVLSRIRTSCRDRSAEIRRQVLSGGLPALSSSKTPSRRREWLQAFRQELLERLVPQIANIDNLPGFNRLIFTLSRKTGGSLNALDLAREVSLPNTSLRRYLQILQRTHLLFLLQPYKKKSTKRLASTPKVYFCDSGLAGLLSSSEELDQNLIETWVAAEIRKILSVAPWHTYMWYFRTRTGREVDFLLEREYRLVGVDVSWKKEISSADLSGLRSCQEAVSDRFRLGVLLYRGTEALALDRNTLALPFPIFFGIET